MNDNFYRSFEDTYRGSRELIAGRLTVYVPFIQPLLEIYPDAAAIDLGCGRGEWLELLVTIGFKAKGVDIDDGMLQACHELGLDVAHLDALSALKELSSESMLIVSAFHVVEHIAFEQLQALVLEAFRVLKPGGMLILETPNPENIVVATRNFYLDPTHQRPIPSSLLSFVADFYGFSRVKTLFLQESKELREGAPVSLMDVLGGVSPDYAIVAQKAAKSSVMSVLDDVFQQEYGLSLLTLVSRYEQRISASTSEIKAYAQQAEALAQQAQVQTQQAEASAQQAESRAQQAEALAQQAQAQTQQAEASAQQAESRAQQAEASAQQAEAFAQQAQQVRSQLEAVYASTSWRLTAPIRRVVGVWKNEKKNAVYEEGKMQPPSWLSTIIGRVGQRVKRSPRVRRLVLRGVHQIPALELKLRRMYAESQLVSIDRQTQYDGQFEAPPQEVAGVLLQESHVQISDCFSSGSGVIRISIKNDGVNSSQRSPLELHIHFNGGG